MRIDDTTAVTPATSATGATGATTAGAAGRSSPVGSTDEFLRLFVAQLENQNPLDPQDGAEFVAQLAQFSAVEQAAQTNSRLAEILAGQMSASNASLAGFVGKTGTVAADQFALSGKGEGLPALGVELDQPAAKLEVIIRDASGAQVKRIELGPQEAGRVAIPWDGTSDTGGALAPGTYRVEVSATGEGGGATAASPVLTGLIQAIDFIDGAPRLRLGAVSAAPSDILSIE
jgi:flagellar basal-body rod modification protein FlgD